jgi:RHS repeat-associated protein
VFENVKNMMLELTELNRSCAAGSARTNDVTPEQAHGHHCGNAQIPYTFSYDVLSRLKSMTSPDGNHNTTYNYDRHGNITSLQRYGLQNGGGYGLIDDVSFTYTGNQLKSASDVTPTILLSTSADFKDYSTTSTEYTYDANGNMTMDLNSGITNISYNILNLPIELNITTPVAVSTNNYTYSADGIKLKSVRTPESVPNKVWIPGLAVPDVTEYCGNAIYNGNGTIRNLKYILTETGYIENGEHYFYLKDHLGNNRVVIDRHGTIVQSNDYYPYGSPFTKATTDASIQPFKYGGKEFETDGGLNTYDFHARTYDPKSTRFRQIDRLAEARPWESPYLYCGGNPLNRTDPTGMIWANSEDKKIAGEMQRDIAAADGFLSRQEDRINAKIDKIENNSKLSDEKKAEKISKQEDRLADVQEQRSVLSDASSGIDQLESSETTYTFNTVSGPSAQLGSRSDGTVVINNFGTNGSKLHETIHAVQYDNGAMTFNPLGSTNVIFHVTPRYLEIPAYKAQYSIQSLTVPNRPRSIFGITDEWVKSIKDGNGKFIYTDDNYK